jgi:hypothetical protein
MLICCNGGPGLPVSASYLNEVIWEASSGRFFAGVTGSTGDHTRKFQLGLRV